MNHRAPAQHGHLAALAHHLGLTDRDGVVPLGNLAPRRAVDPFRFHEDHGIFVADAGQQQPLGVDRVRRHHHLQSRNVDEQRFGRLRMVVAALDAAADRRADDQRRGIFAARPIAQLRQLVHDLVVRRVDEVRELNLGDGAQAVQRHADRGADDPRLGQRRVHAALGAEFLVKAGRRAKNSTETADVLAHDDDARIAPHLQSERVVHSLDDVHVGHGDPEFGGRAANWQGDGPAARWQGLRQARPGIKTGPSRVWSWRSASNQAPQQGALFPRAGAWEAVDQCAGLAPCRRMCSSSSRNCSSRCQGTFA